MCLLLDYNINALSVLHHFNLKVTNQLEYCGQIKSGATYAGADDKCVQHGRHNSEPSDECQNISDSSDSHADDFVNENHSKLVSKEGDNDKVHKLYAVDDVVADACTTATEERLLLVRYENALHQLDVWHYLSVFIRNWLPAFRVILHLSSSIFASLHLQDIVDLALIFYHFLLLFAKSCVLAGDFEVLHAWQFGVVFKHVHSVLIEVDVEPCRVREYEKLLAFLVHSHCYQVWRQLVLSVDEAATHANENDEGHYDEHELAHAIYERVSHDLEHQIREYHDGEEQQDSPHGNLEQFCERLAVTIAQVQREVEVLA